MRQYKAIDYLGDNGLVFWDYGNAFLLECSRAFSEGNAELTTSRANDISTRFKYPSYMQDVMGDIFSLGFGPFRYLFQNIIGVNIRILFKCISDGYVLQEPILT